MQYLLDGNETDDQEFIFAVETIIRSLEQSVDPETLFVIRIKNWFDYKWVDAFDENPGELPEFTTNRLLSQWSFVRAPVDTESNEVGDQEGTRRESKNLQKDFIEPGESAIVIWYSTNTAINGRGSLMVYQIKDEQPLSWYAAFERRAGKWVLGKTKGIPRDDLVDVLESDA